ncbi:MAG: polyprenyl synthetase family protein [Maritimibacter sp.]
MLDKAANKPHERLAEHLSDDLKAVERMIRERTTSKNAPRIPEVTAHLMEAGGKRLRPMLTIASARLCGYEGDKHIQLATAVEFVHTATLLHDDVVDESEQRRGRPTANLMWDNKSSILVGDYLFARSFQLMTETDKLQILRILADAAFTITEGEVLQFTAARNLSTSEDIYFEVARAKTSALFSAATQTGGILAGVSDDLEQALFDYGDALGIAFQVTDDVLDFFGDETLGKRTGDDFRERKLTLPIIKTIAKADDAERAFWTRTIEAGDQTDDDLQTALAIMKKHGTLDETRAVALHWADVAKASIAKFPDDPIRDMLSDIADFVVERIS